MWSSRDKATLKRYSAFLYMTSSFSLCENEIIIYKELNVTTSWTLIYRHVIMSRLNEWQNYSSAVEWNGASKLPIEACQKSYPESEQVLTWYGWLTSRESTVPFDWTRTIPSCIIVLVQLIFHDHNCSINESYTREIMSESCVMKWVKQHVH